LFGRPPKPTHSVSALPVMTTAPASRFFPPPPSLFRPPPCWLFLFNRDLEGFHLSGSTSFQVAGLPRRSSILTLVPKFFGLFCFVTPFLSRSCFSTCLFASFSLHLELTRHFSFFLPPLFLLSPLFIAWLTHFCALGGSHCVFS